MDCIREHGIYSPSLWGFKATGYYHLSSHKEELHSLLTNHDLPREDVFYRVMDTPGLGLAKTGFLMQLYGWETACIDMHNAKRFNIPVPRCPSTLKTDTKMKKIIEYLIMCDQIGGSEYLWDQWCEYVAGNRMNKNLPTAEAVSLYHKECICG